MVCGILQRHLQPDVSVWVFGSRAKWTTHDGSDLDLALEGDDKLGPETIRALEDDFEESDLPYKVDVVDLKTVNLEFRQIIDVQKISLTISELNLHQIPVSEVATVSIGGTPSRDRSEYWEGTIQWVTAKDIAKNNTRYLYESQESITDLGLARSSAKIVPRNTILITSRGTVGALAQLGKEMAFNQTCYAIVPNSLINNRQYA